MTPAFGRSGLRPDVGVAPSRSTRFGKWRAWMWMRISCVSVSPVACLLACLLQQILCHLRDAALPGYSRILILDMVLPVQGAALAAAAFDVHMMAMFSARERTEAAWRRLLDDCGGLRVVGLWTDPQGLDTVIEVEVVWRCIYMCVYTYIYIYRSMDGVTLAASQHWTPRGRPVYAVPMTCGGICKQNEN